MQLEFIPSKHLENILEPYRSLHPKLEIFVNAFLKQTKDIYILHYQNIKSLEEVYVLDKEVKDYLNRHFKTLNNYQEPINLTGAWKLEKKVLDDLRNHLPPYSGSSFIGQVNYKPDITL